MLVVCVDDSILVGKVRKFIFNFKALFSERFEIEDLGPATWLLGCRIERDRERRTLRFGHDKYISEIVEEFGMSSSTPLGTPMVAKPVVEANGDELFNKKMFPFPSLIGKLLYCSNNTRPNIIASQKAHACLPPMCITDNKLSAS
jgi:hypothetical protein